MVGEVLTTYIIEIIVNNVKNIKNFFIGWILVPIMFGSFAPAMPFFIVMAAMFAVVKYLMGFFRKL